jgi:simple sugar transport system ATP-binding protein
VAQPPVLELRGITKRFPGIVANDHIDLDLQQGEVHALLGENGAGKSTLMNIVYGLYHPDEGQILVKGREIQLGSPKEAIEAGIGMVHQHFMLIPVMSVAENIVLATEPRTGGVLLDYDAARARVRELSQRYGLAVDPDARIENISVGQQQRVEILKALYRGADILILDEPTAVLTPQEASELFEVVRSLTEQGKSVIFISHKLNEVTEIATRISVLRRGKLIDTVSAEGATEDSLARLMVGRDVLLRVEKQPARPGEPLLQVEDLHVVDDRELEAVRGVSLEVRAGEILGIAGVDGNGQRELVEALCGMRRARAGRVLLDGREITDESTQTINRLGVSHIPENREKHGFVANFSVATNLVLERFDEPPFAKGFLRDFGAVEAHARDLVERFDVRPRDIDNRMGSLSGGNKQKVIVARELSQGARLVIAAQPTRGVDVGSIEFIHKQIVAGRDAGMAVLVVSTELDEVVSLADRIMVLYRGRVVGIVPADTPREVLGLMMTGERPEGAIA